jgi:dipeptidyl aminopeptidase/acylaminoacyl peptidase
MKTTTAPVREALRSEVGDPNADAPLLAKLTPLNDVERIRAPLFVYAGANDPRVPRSEADQIVMALRERGARVEYFVAANEGHSLAHRENQVALWARAARFVESALEKRQAGR